jgi:hypothetical protein
MEVVLGSFGDVIGKFHFKPEIFASENGLKSSTVSSTRRRRKQRSGKAQTPETNL